jgi:hypothetical protein
MRGVTTARACPAYDRRDIGRPSRPRSMTMNRFTPIALALACALAPALASAAAPSIATPANTVDGLLPAAVEVLRQKVLVQCGLGEATDRLPWYFHFEFGRALLEAGDARRAVTQLAQSVDLNPVPRADKRLYGMWFTDYLPYFQLADAHARLENWPCAAHALELSRSSGETESGRLDPQRVRAVEEAIGLHGDALGACQMKDVLDPRYADAGFRG